MAASCMVVDHHAWRSSSAPSSGPKADPTTTTYMPRPEWYFFFLFEVLRVIKPPSARAAGGDRRADGLHDPAVPAAVLRPRPERRPERRPIATAAGIFTIAAMALPHVPRRDRRLADPDRDGDAADGSWPRARRRSPSSRPASRSSRSRAAWPATRSARTATAARARPVGDRRAAARQAIARTLVNPTAPMPAYTEPADAREARRPRRLPRAAASAAPMSDARAARTPRRAPSRSRRCGRCSTASPASTTS